MDSRPVHRLRTLYDQLWSRGIDKIRSGKVDLDPVLRSPSPDLRRGFTVVARPSLAVQRRVACFLNDLGRIEPEQYFYARSEFHVTVLSLFAATLKPAPFFAQRAAYMGAVGAAVREAGAFRLSFKGVTASPGTVMIQGFFRDETLNELRESLREQLRARGLDGGVDQRYRLETAHMTVMRFRAPLQSGERLA